MTYKLFILGFVTLLGACSGSEQVTTINESPSVSTPSADIMDFVDTITQEGLRADLTVLSHDSLQGRDTGTDGLKKAARYIAKRYAEIGLEPVGDNGTYFQKVDFDQNSTNSRTYTVTDTEGNLISETTHSKNDVADYNTFGGGANSATGDIVFVGAGIVNEANGVNHFAEDMSGKWLLMFFQQGVTNFGIVQRTIAQSNALGALLIIDTPERYAELAEGAKVAFGNPQGFQLSYLADGNNQGGGTMFARVKPAHAADLLGVNGAEELDALKDNIFESPADFSARETGMALAYNPDRTGSVLSSKNIVAFLEGSDPLLKDEVVVISSHYDHVGIGQPDSTGDNIYNGADDDGSGTAGLMHIAQAMVAAKEAGAGPKRSVLFLHVTAEEKGLLGSRYYSDHPIYPIDKTVANVNVDMIGRIDNEYTAKNDGDYIYLIGGEIISSGLDKMVREANAETSNLELSKRYNDLNDPNQFYRRSDHWNFGRLGVPFLFFFNGVHPDYHQPGDEIDKIEFEPFQKRTQLIYAFTAKIADTDERPIVDNQDFIEVTRTQARN